MAPTTLLFVIWGALLIHAQSVDLGAAGLYAALAPASITNTGPSVITGNIGTTGTSVTGFPPGILIGETHIADVQASNAQTAFEAAYVQAQGLERTVDESGPGAIGGLMFMPGVYEFSGAVVLDGTLTLSGSGTYVFQLPSTLTTISGSRMVLTDGASACNVYWSLGSAATIGTDSVAVGNFLAGTAITVTTGAVVSGGLYARSAITLDTNSVSACGARNGNPSTSSSAAPPSTSTTSAPPDETSPPPAASSSATASSSRSAALPSSSSAPTATASPVGSSTSGRPSTACEPVATLKTVTTRAYGHGQGA